MRIRWVITVMFLLTAMGSAAADSDPVGTQIFTTPTAQTLGEGELRVSSTMLTLTQFNYGLTDDLQLGVQTVYLFWTGVDLKYRFFQSEKVEASVLGGGGLWMLNHERHSVYVRPVVTISSDDRNGRGSARLSLGGSALYNATAAASGILTNVFVSGELPAGTNVKLMGEINYVYDPATTVSGDLTAWSGGTFGARFYGERAAVDAGLFIPFTDDLLPGRILGIPLLSFSYLF